MAQGNYREEFPEFGELDVALPDLFADTSWHNDACPKFQRELPDGSTLTVWVDFEDKALSDFPSYPRFATTHYYTEDKEGLHVQLCPALATDSWDEVLAWVADIVRRTVLE